MTPTPPRGTFRLIEKAPLGWWAQPVDAPAKEWTVEHPAVVVQGCIQVPGRRLIPPGAPLRRGDER